MSTSRMLTRREDVRREASRREEVWGEVDLFTSDRLEGIVREAAEREGVALAEEELGVAEREDCFSRLSMPAISAAQLGQLWV